MNLRHRVTARRALSILAVTFGLLLTMPSALAADEGFDLPEEGILLEGIGVDDRSDFFYVSGVNDGGDIYRGRPGSDQLERWVDADGTTGRGIDVDDHGRVFVAGGPTGTLRIFDRFGAVVATVANGAADSFLNDVWVQPDGSVLVTDSALPTLWIVDQDASGTWSIEPLLDVSGTISYTPAVNDFDLGGVVTTADGRYAITSQGTTGQLWRIDLTTDEITEFDLGGASIPNADGIVLRGEQLFVVQNFVRQISLFELDVNAASGSLVNVTPTSPDGTFTTAAIWRGRLLVVDSQFGFDPAQAPATDRVVALRPSLQPG